jgi:mRNA-degrading endonuclease RelE of RelBE toxin-antitoxin system
MANKVIALSDFLKDLKKLVKKYPNLTNKVEALIDQLEVNAFLGDVIPNSGGLHKIRIEGENKGKSGGYRVITYSISAEKSKDFKLDEDLQKAIKDGAEHIVSLVSIYDKSEQSDVTGSSLKKFVDFLFPKKSAKDKEKQNKNKKSKK